MGTTEAPTREQDVATVVAALGTLTPVGQRRVAKQALGRLLAPEERDPYAASELEAALGHLAEHVGDADCPYRLEALLDSTAISWVSKHIPPGDIDATLSGLAIATCVLDARLAGALGA